MDLKRRIQGDFYVIEEDDEKIVFGNRACPFAEKVVGRPAMCMMTSNVFGGIAAENLGYAKVVLEETIAEGDPGCRVVVYLKPTPEAEAADGPGILQGVGPPMPVEAFLKVADRLPERDCSSSRAEGIVLGGEPAARPARHRAAAASGAGRSPRSRPSRPRPSPPTSAAARRTASRSPARSPCGGPTAGRSPCRADGSVLGPPSDGAEAVVLLRLDAEGRRPSASSSRSTSGSTSSAGRSSAGSGSRRSSASRGSGSRVTLASIGDAVIATDAEGRVTS